MAKTGLNFLPVDGVGIRVLACMLLCFTISPAALRAQGGSGALQQLQQGSQLPAQNRIPSGVSPTPAPEGVADMKLAPGSLVDIQVFEEPDLNGSYRLDSHGQIELPFAGAIKLEFMTLPEAEAAVVSKLETEQVLKTAHVVVNIDQYSTQNVVVLGEVNSPGRYPVLGQRKLMDVLAMAGGETALAGNEIVIHRFQQPPEVIENVHYGHDANGPVALDTEVNPGDTVLVKRVGVVYVLGSVSRPGGYAMQEAGELNIDEAIALAQGTLPEANVRNIMVLREQPDKSLITWVVDYKKLNKGSILPLQLKPEDVVYVPVSGWKFTALRGIGVLSGTASATIYKAP